MDLIKNGWFSEISDFIPGHCMSLQVKNILCSMKTEYQDLLIFESTNHGRVLVLDGMIQLTERDEFMYQEMMAMLPLTCHPNPEKVLIIGGGDGGVAREVLKHPSVKVIVQCELDKDVIEMSKKYLPFTSESYKDEKVKVVIGDGLDYLTNLNSEFDVLISDSSDPIGPAANLFEINYFEKIKDTLKPDGLMCSQGEGLWLENMIVSQLVNKAKKVFPVVKYAYGSVPTYPLGQIGYLLCSKNEATDFSKPLFDITEVNDKFRYYTKEIHSASLVLPNCMKNVVFDVLENLLIFPSRFWANEMFYSFLALVKSFRSLMDLFDACLLLNINTI